jgi:hypothetical protein
VNTCARSAIGAHPTRDDRSEKDGRYAHRNDGPTDAGENVDTSDKLTGADQQKEQDDMSDSELHAASFTT